MGSPNRLNLNFLDFQFDLKIDKKCDLIKEIPYENAWKKCL